MLKLTPPQRWEARIEDRRRREDTTGIRPVWSPQTGPQSAAYASEADIIGYGGAAGGGKTDLMLGLAATKHRHSIIFRRVFPSLRGIIERSRAIFRPDDRPTPLGSYNETLHVWRLTDGRMVEFGAVQHEADKSKHQGQPRDFFGFDEATEFPESTVRFLIGWNRTTVTDQKCRVLLTFNPPMTDAGSWVTRFFAPWLDPEHPRPAANGELRWFAMVDGQEREVGPEPFDHDGQTITPKSRTFFRALLKDNPILEATGYGSTIDAMPEPLRSLLKGDFHAARIADPWQLIPGDWVRAAQARWRATPPPAPGSIPTMSGMDVAHGGADKTVLARRFDRHIAELDAWPGSATPTGMAAAQVVVHRLPAGSPLNVDAIGYGASAAERLADAPPAGFGMKARPVNVAERSEYRDRSKRFRMVNLRAEMFWRLREALDPEGDTLLALPPDQELLADLCAPTYEITTAGIKVESKPEIAARLGRSPDRGDAVALAMLPGPPITQPPRVGGQRPHLSGYGPGRR